MPGAWCLTFLAARLRYGERRYSLGTVPKELELGSLTLGIIRGKKTPQPPPPSTDVFDTYNRAA